MSDLFPLTVRDAVASRQGKRLVGPVNLDLSGQGACVVLGPNGSGKTTLLRLLHGIARLNKGQITWSCPKAEAQRRQAFVFQHPVMLRRSVLDNLAYPLLLRGVPRKSAQTEAAKMAERIGVSQMLDRPARVLSGGERQKVSLGRALICKPDLLFLDEPSASLDGRATREIEDILQSAKSAGTALILATHDMGQARRLADRVVFLLGGQVHEEGTATDFFARPKTQEAAAFLKGDIVEC
ncbi:amino acid ABC transporter ATP-binding protein [Aliishimia ponticola]|uniref:Amino acid ABC transporter ATP-binding protein n=1 Tax=Aliishimia ponticola TaxID=2499833 RepID=A0A4S4NFJ4_9RHOB|nr:ATP-binding cassette domain-containing protein [Aliishimia ponticola]THH34840.1 amino acid ABC transporter ATP-binding protein [Aliishimia ponticola]